MSPPTDKSIVVRNVVVGLVIVAGVTAAILYRYRDRLFTSPEAVAPVTESGRSGGAGDDPDGPVVGDGSVVAPAPPTATDATDRLWSELLGDPPTWPDALTGVPGCEEADRDLEAACRLLDERADGLESHGGACRLIREVGEDLAAKPPRPVAELRSHDRMLSNAFHVFRVLGRDRTRLLKRTLEDQEDLVEPLSLAGFRWALSRENCRGRASSSIRLETLYEYSAFLFNTLGGQAYLRRRSPRIEALACFYALQVLDTSIERGHNPLGLDPRPEIRRCRQLVRGQPLVFAADYAEALDRMERRWRQPAH